MKLLLLGLAVFCVSGNAAPPKDSGDGRLVTGPIYSAIQEFRESIRENGYDPFIKEYNIEHRLAVTDLLVLKVDVEELLVVGLSHIMVDDLSYNPITARVYYRLIMPRVSLRIDVSVHTKTFGHDTNTRIRGSVDMVDSHLTGVIRITKSLIGNYSVRWISAIYWVGYVESNLRATIFDVDYTAKFNDFFINTLPRLIREDADNVNEFFEHMMWLAVPQRWT